MSDSQLATPIPLEVDDRAGSGSEENTSIGSHGIVRQAIVDTNRAVIGYELFEVPAATSHTNGMLFDAVSHASGDGPLSGRLILMRCTFEHIEGNYLELLNPDKVVLEVPVAAGPLDADEIARQQTLLSRARKVGFRLAFDHSVVRAELASWLPLASMVRLDMRTLTLPQAEHIAHDVLARSKARLLASRIETDSQYAQLKRAGVKLFQGQWYEKPAPVGSARTKANHSTVLQLLGLVRREAEFNEIEEVLKRDPTLSFNLLRFINSCGFGLNSEISSFRHAVMILGLKKLFRWATLLMTTTPAAGVAPAAGNLAIVRGRLMELLVAELMPADSCDDAFIVGVFSMLETLLGIPMAEALEPLNLSVSVNNALLHDQGDLALFLRMVKCCESNDEVPFNQTAEALQLSSHQVNFAHLQALAWADELEA